VWERGGLNGWFYFILFLFFHHSPEGGLVARAKRMHGDGITTYNSPSGNVDDTRDGGELFVRYFTYLFLKDISHAGF